MIYILSHSLIKFINSYQTLTNNIIILSIYIVHVKQKWYDILVDLGETARPTSQHETLAWV